MTPGEDVDKDALGLKGSDWKGKAGGKGGSKGGKNGKMECYHCKGEHMLRDCEEFTNIKDAERAAKGIVKGGPSNGTKGGDFGGSQGWGNKSQNGGSQYGKGSAQVQKGFTPWGKGAQKGGFGGGKSGYGNGAWNQKGGGRRTGAYGLEDADLAYMTGAGDELWGSRTSGGTSGDHR